MIKIEFDISGVPRINDDADIYIDVRDLPDLSESFEDMKNDWKISDNYKNLSNDPKMLDVGHEELEAALYNALNKYNTKKDVLTNYKLFRQAVLNEVHRFRLVNFVGFLPEYPAHKEQGDTIYKFNEFHMYDAGKWTKLDVQKDEYLILKIVRGGDFKNAMQMLKLNYIGDRDTYPPHRKDGDIFYNKTARNLYYYIKDEGWKEFCGTVYDEKDIPEIDEELRKAVVPKYLQSPNADAKHNSEVKAKAKDGMRTKFIKNKKYKLRIKSIEGSSPVEHTFICKGIIHKIKDEIVNIVIMKSVNCTPRSAYYQHTAYCINKYDCEKFHIKYEHGLEVFSSKLNWVPVK